MPFSFIATFPSQVISRGQIQHSSQVPLSLVASDIPAAVNLLEPMAAPVNQSTVRGQTTITIRMPATMSPSAQVS